MKCKYTFPHQKILTSKDIADAYCRFRVFYFVQWYLPCVPTNGMIRLELNHRIILYFDLDENNVTSLVAQMVKHLTTMQETQVPSMGWEDPLEKEMATHSSTLAWKIPWTEEEHGRLQSMGSQRVGHD